MGDKYPTKDGTGVGIIPSLTLPSDTSRQWAGYALRRADIYNLGEQRLFGIGLLTAFQRQAAVNTHKVEAPVRRCGGVYADPSKAEKELGWKAERDINTMCEDTWRWQNKNERI